MRKIALIVGILVAFTMATPLLAEDDFYLYWEWEPGLPDSVKYVTGVNGYVDTEGEVLLGGC